MQVVISTRLSLPKSMRQLLEQMHLCRKRFEERKGNDLECGDLSPLWYAATCRRFGMRRLDAAFFAEIQLRRGRDKSRPTKALTSQRTPKTLRVAKPYCS